MTDYRNDIEKYLKGELSPVERNALERKALHDPFLADALEGAEQIKAGEFSGDVTVLNERIANRKSVSIWMWPARIAAGLVIIAVSSYIVWTVMKPEPVQDLAFEKNEPVTSPSISSDSTTPATGVLSSPPVEQPAAGPTVRDKDIATRSTPALKTETKPTQEASGESVLKNEAVAKAIVAEETKVEDVKTEGISVTEPVAVTKPTEKEAEFSKAKAEEDDQQERKKLAYKSLESKKKDAAPAAADKRESGLASSTSPNKIRGQVTSVEDGSALPGVNVVIKGSTIGTVTDVQGNYEIEVDRSNPTLVYSFIGLQSTEVEAKGRTEISMQMALDAAQLSEVVVVGYGTEGAGETLPPTVDLAHPEIGNRAFKQYLEKNLRYPERAKKNKVEGRVTVQFTVEANGTLTNFTIIRGIGSGCDEELIRLIKEGPKWIPTKKDNVPVQGKAKVRLKFDLLR